MSSIDDKIREALKAEDAELFEAVGGEATVPELVAESFRGKYRFFVVVTWAFSLVFFVASIYCLYRVFVSAETQHQILWSLGFIYSTVAVAMLKMWNWMELNRLAVTREVKRVELQIAVLAKRLER